MAARINRINFLKRLSVAESNYVAGNFRDAAADYHWLAEHWTSEHRGEDTTLPLVLAAIMWRAGLCLSECSQFGTALGLFKV